MGGVGFSDDHVKFSNQVRAKNFYKTEAHYRNHPKGDSNSQPVTEFLGEEIFLKLGPEDGDVPLTYVDEDEFDDIDTEQPCASIYNKSDGKKIFDIYPNESYTSFGGLPKRQLSNALNDSYFDEKDR